jgi:hypothetical protein
VATEAEHLAKAKRNEAFAAQRSIASEADWKIVASFYAALHYVETVIVRSGRRSSVDHNQRNQLVRTLPEFAPIRSDYLALGNHAWSARYDPSFDWLDPSVANQVQQICDLLIRIKQGLKF